MLTKYIGCRLSPLSGMAFALLFAADVNPFGTEARPARRKRGALQTFRPAIKPSLRLRCQLRHNEGPAHD